CYYLTAENIDAFFDNDVPFQPIERNDHSDFKIEVNIPANAPDAFGIVKARVFFDIDATEDNEIATFIVNKGNVGVEIIDMKDERVAVFPNPGDEQLVLFTDLSLDARSFQVIDLNGRILLPGKMSVEASVVDA